MEEVLGQVVEGGRIARCAVVTDDGFVLACAPAASLRLGVGQVVEDVFGSAGQVARRLGLGALRECQLFGDDGAVFWLRLGPAEALLGVAGSDADLAWFALEMRQAGRRLLAEAGPQDRESSASLTAT